MPGSKDGRITQRTAFQLPKKQHPPKTATTVTPAHGTRRSVINLPTAFRDSGGEKVAGVSIWMELIWMLSLGNLQAGQVLEKICAPRPVHHIVPYKPMSSSL